jgi:hypothetical protein
MFRPAEVAGQDDDRALSQQRLDRRQGGHDPAVVRDPAILEGNVEVDADEDALTCRVQVPDGELVHLDLGGRLGATGREAGRLDDKAGRPLRVTSASWVGGVIGARR